MHSYTEIKNLSLTSVFVNNSSSLRVQLAMSKLWSIAFLMFLIETSLASASAVKAVKPVLSNLKSIQIWTKIKSNIHQRVEIGNKVHNQKIKKPQLMYSVSLISILPYIVSPLTSQIQYIEWETTYLNILNFGELKKVNFQGN